MLIGFGYWVWIKNRVLMDIGFIKGTVNFD
jgi:hypothetical protein